MKTITYLRLTREIFNVNSLDMFKRFQEVKECRRKIDNQNVLVKNEYIEDWDLNKVKNIAKNTLDLINKNSIVYGAF